MNEGIRVMRKSELRRKKVKFLCAIGLELRALPQKEQQAFKDGSTLCGKYSIKEIVQIFHGKYGSFFWLRLKLKLRERDLYTFKSHFLN